MDIFKLLLERERKGVWVSEKGEGREKERTRNINVREKHCLVTFHRSSKQESNPEPRYVP